MAELTGLARVLEDAGAGESVLPGDAEQLALLGMTLPEPKRGVGRPAGRVNKRTADVARYILTNVGDPLIELARLAMLSPEALAASVGCSKSEALAEKRLLLLGLLPYTHSKMPIAVNVNATLPMLVMADPRDFAPPRMVEGEIEEIQPLEDEGNG